ncbi:SPOR domain-containing protein [Palleronia pelagia]|uniref:Sporulation related domain-containing protein n=1 Tax=Palleronia pelagia TaxID=387096 RepID=A0A1H8D4T1_9RHOB|nr:SPOR domain-containing protein [Palleronia pelagia]SEN01618.1 Sporulation related domain-containing protein [Palleronia pelagia]
MNLTRSIFRPLSLAIAALALAGCVGGDGPFGGGRDGDAPGSRTTELVERDVEAPEVFQVTEPGLWDGRPSLGGVWVAHPDVDEPERVIIRNESNGNFVIGALFRRERENPGPRLQVSSDAAEALGMLAGAPTTLNVTALRREESSAEPATTETTVTPETDAAEADTESLSAPDTIAAQSLDAPAASEAPASQPTETAPVRPVSSLDKPFIQIGIFSVQDNAQNTAQSLRGIGVVPTVKEQTTQGKTFYRVIVEPATNSADRAAVLAKVKELGFEDAYYVSG